MPESWTVDDVLLEIQNAAEYMKKRKQLGLDESRNTSLIDTINHKTKCIHNMSSKEAGRILDACDVLPDSFAKTISDVVDRIVTSMPHEANGGLRVSNEPSDCIYMHNLLTKEEWDTIMDKGASILMKMYTIIKRLKKLGVRSISEQTVKWCVAIILSSMSGLPTYHVIFAMVNDFKKLFHSDTTLVSQCTFIAKYPASADLLPPALFKTAYTDSQEAPFPHTPEKLHALAAHHIPLRPTSKLLKEETQRMSAVTSAAARAAVKSASLHFAPPKEGGTGGMPDDSAGLAGGLPPGRRVIG